MIKRVKAPTSFLRGLGASAHLISCAFCGSFFCAFCVLLVELFDEVAVAFIDDFAFDFEGGG